MHQTSRYGVCSIFGNKAKALDLPYKGKRLSMIIILPNEKNGIYMLEKEYAKLDASNLCKSKSGKVLFQRKYMVNLALPKFKLMSKLLELKESLKKFGMRNMFDPKKANFSGITERMNIYVSNVIQKSVMEVNEQGAEGASSTSVRPRNQFRSRLRRLRIIRKQFICDHPFLFMIKDNLTGFILLSGKIIKPI